MTQIALAIASTAIVNTDSECWFCKEEPAEKGVKNEEEANPDTSDSESAGDVPENHEKNDASKLGENLGSKPAWTITCPNAKKDTTVLSAAHHCIPGNASFLKAETLLTFMREGGPLKLASDIGYNINHKNNGVWLPGNYNVRKGKEHYTKSWGKHKTKFKNEYAKRAINNSSVQFHDAHPAYSENVLETLENIAEKIGKPADKCPMCKEPYDKTRPPYGLVGRLDFVSSQHKIILRDISIHNGKRYVQSGYFTSSRVKKYFGIED